MSAPSAPGRLRPKLVGCGVNLALVLGSLLLCLGALEVGLRLFGPKTGDWYATGPERLEFLRDHVTRNRHRFRDREFSVQRTPDRVRILAVGDSFTFGDGIENPEETWPKVLERELTAGGVPYEVYNLGVPGTNTAFQRRMMIDRDVYALSPDRIVLGFVLNDPEPPDANLTIVPRRLYPPLLPIRAVDARLTRASHAYAWLRQAKNALLERWELKETYADYIHTLYDPASTHWQDFVEQAVGFVEDARARGVTVTVMIFPMFYDLESYAFSEEHRMAAEVFRSAGAEVVDLLGVFENVPTSSVQVSPRNAHPNERAHRIAAETLARHLLQR